MPGALQADKFGDVLQVLAEDVLIAFCEHRHGARSQFEQPGSACEVVQNINCKKANALFRKKLFRSQATASTRLGEQNKIIHELSRTYQPQGSEARQGSTGGSGFKVLGSTFKVQNDEKLEPQNLELEHQTAA